jgi:hypothetical protein
MGAYDGIGVGVRPIPSPSKAVIPAKTVSHETAPQKEMEGLGYEMELDAGTIDVSTEMSRGEGSSSSSKTIVLEDHNLVNLDKTDEAMPQAIEQADVEVEDVDLEFPSLEEMKSYQDRLAGSSEVDNKDLVGMVRPNSITPSLQDISDSQVKSLLEPCLNHLPILRDQLEAQKATIQTLQHQAKLSKQLTSLER